MGTFVVTLFISAVTAVVIAGVLIFAVTVVAVKTYSCKHLNRYWDGDTNSIICEDCGRVIHSFSAQEMDDLTLNDLYV